MDVEILRREFLDDGRMCYPARSGNLLYRYFYVPSRVGVNVNSSRHFADTPDATTTALAATGAEALKGAKAPASGASAATSDANAAMPA